MQAVPFASSTPFTVATELELQLLDRTGHGLCDRTHEFVDCAGAPAARLRAAPGVAPGLVKVSTNTHVHIEEMIAELRDLRSAMEHCARKMDAEVAGGGAHPLKKTAAQNGATYDPAACPADNAATGLFGMRIRIGTENGDDALYLTHGLARFVPHFIALSAASPFYGGVDTTFDSARSNVVLACPSSGTVPLHVHWSQFAVYYEEARQQGAVCRPEDFAWDVRPRPDLGSVEITVCDTPLTITLAASLCGYAVALSRWLLAERPLEIDPHFYFRHQHNRFQASRHGMEAQIAEQNGRGGLLPQSLFMSLLERLRELERFAQDEAEMLCLQRLRQAGYERRNGAALLRRKYAERRSLTDLTRLAAELWKADPVASGS